MKLLFAAIASVAAVAVSPSFAQSPAPASSSNGGVPIDADKRKMITEMMELTQTAHFADDMVAQTLAAMKASMPNVPAEFWNEFQKKMDPTELKQRMYAAYDRYFTKDDLKAALAFYHTDIGQKMLSEMPALTRDLMAAGQEWGQKTGAIAAQELDKRGLLKKPAAGGSPSSSAARSPAAKASATAKP